MLCPRYCAFPLIYSKYRQNGSVVAIPQQIARLKNKENSHFPKEGKVGGQSFILYTVLSINK